MFKVIQAVVTTLFLIFPLSLAKSMSALRYISLVSIGSILYTLIVMLAEVGPYFNHYHNQKGDEIHYAIWDWEFFNGASITFFSFTC